MKKWVVIELIALVALLVFAVFICACGPLGIFSEQTLDTQAATETSETAKTAVHMKLN